MTVSEYINMMAAKSKTPEHELIPACLEYFGIRGTKDLTLEQAAKFYEMLKRHNEE